MKQALLSAALFLLFGNLYAQAPHVVEATFEATPAGPNSEFLVNLTLAPADVNVVGFDFSIGYDNTKGTLQSVIDNTGQPHAAVEYTVGNERALEGVSYANVFRPVAMSTISDLMLPDKLAQLKFKTASTYADPENQFYVYISGWSQGSTGSGGVLANINGTWERIPVTYESINPSSAIDDWMVY